MNYIKVQKEIFNRMVCGDRVCYFPIGDEKIFVTADGYKGYIIPLDIIAFNCNKLQEMKAADFDSVVKAENELKMTDDLKKYRYCGRDVFCVRLKANGKSIFVNMKYLENFHNPKFFQYGKNTNWVVVTETIGKEHKDVPVGIVCPVRSDTWGDNYYMD